MSELGDFLKAVAEAKADYEQNDPKGRQKKEIQDTIKMETKVGLGDLFKELASLKAQVEQIENQEDVPVLENEEMWSSRVIDEEPKLITRIAIPESNLYLPEPEPINEDMGWGQNDIQQYAKSDAFKKHKPVWQPPNGDGPELKGLKDQIKMLEQWISRIASTGPGSGEVNFRYLDDVDRSTMNPGNDNWVLEYNSANGHVQFTEDIGPIRTIKFNTLGPILNGIPGMIAWNPIEDCLDIYQADGTTLQTGLENYIQVYNDSGSKLENGTVVRFSGAHDGVYDEPTVVPHIANGTIPPLYTVGVITTDIEYQQQGRATTFGKVRGVNTTGSDVGETWNLGEILYVSTQYPGKFTKTKPTAPNVVISVAAVLKVHANTGVLLVRPTIYPRLYYGSFSSTVDQYANTISVAVPMTLNTTNIANGFHTANTINGSGNTMIVAENSGLYNFQFSLQVISTNSSSKNLWIWPRKNGTDIPNSATRLTITGKAEYRAPSRNFVVSLNAGDAFELFWGVDDTSIRLDAPPAQPFCPAIPSVILTVTEVAL